MTLPLPPKRFMTVDDAKYDPIRHKRWFKTLEERRHKIPLLRAAYRRIVDDKVPQGEAAEAFVVDERELRDYMAFVRGTKDPVSRAFQVVLDESYELYNQKAGSLSIRACIATVAPQFGLNPRHVTEAWEIDPFFWPTGYTHFS